MLVEILNGYEKKGPMAAKDSKAFVTTNIINYFFGALNAIVAFALFPTYNIDAPFTFALISLTHFSLTLYTNSHKGFWKRYCTLTNASLFTILLGYAFDGVLPIQILFFREKVAGALVLHPFSIPYSHLTLLGYHRRNQQLTPFP
jgi:hypothetical protein